MSSGHRDIVAGSLPVVDTFADLAVYVAPYDGYAVITNDTDTIYIYDQTTETWNPYSSTDPTVTARITNLEDKYVRTSRFITINSPTTSGTVTLPSGSIVVLDDFGGTVDAVISGASGGRPTFTNVYSSGSTIISTSFNSSGNYVLSGTPSSYPISLIYRVRQKLKDFDSTSLDIIGDPDYGSYPGDYVLKTGDIMTGQLVLPSFKLKSGVHELLASFDGSNTFNFQTSDWLSFIGGDVVTFNAQTQMGFNIGGTGNGIALTSGGDIIASAGSASGNISFMSPAGDAEFIIQHYIRQSFTDGGYILTNASFGATQIEATAAGVLNLTSLGGSDLSITSSNNLVLSSSGGGFAQFAVSAIPNSNISYDLGATGLAWRSLYVQEVKDENDSVIVDVKNKMLFEPNGLALDFSNRNNVQVPLAFSAGSDIVSGGNIGARAINLSGTGGDGFIEMPSQSMAPTVPATGFFRIYSNNQNFLSLVDDSARVVNCSLSGVPISTTLDFVYPNSSGTIALIQNSLAGSVIFAPNTNVVVSALSLKANIASPTFTGTVTLPTGSTSAAPLKFVSGTNKTTAAAGEVEYNGTNLFFTRSGTTRENVLVGNSGASAPSTTIGIGIVNFYGSSATNFLGQPNSWASVVIGGTTYKIPLYT